MLLLLLAGASAEVTPPEPSDGGHNYLARMAALNFVEQAQPRPKRRRRRRNDIWWFE